MINELITLDEQLLVYLNSLGNTNWDSFWMLITNKFTTVPIYLVLLYFIYRKIGIKKTIIVFLFAILLITAADQLANLFKYGFKRLRPCHNLAIKDIIRSVKPHCGGKYSYFSGHASTSMSLAVYFGILLKKMYSKTILYILLLISILVGYSRIYIGVHFPLDVLTGFVLGGIIAIVFYLFTRFSFTFISNNKT